MIKGIDVSEHQAIIDWTKVKAAGIEFAIIRAGYGKNSNQVDKYFHTNIKAAQAAGVKVGAYHYSYAQSVEDAKKEAAFFLSLIKGYKLEYPVAFDIEDPSQKALGKQKITDIALTFCDTVEKAGYFTMIYCNPAWIKSYLDMTKLSRFGLWLANWGVSSPSYKCGIWQYTSDGSVPGIRGRVDMNYSYADYTEIIKKNGLNGFMDSTPALVQALVENPSPSVPTVPTGSNITPLNGGFGYIESLPERVIIHYDQYNYICIWDGKVTIHIRDKPMREI